MLHVCVYSSILRLFLAFYHDGSGYGKMERLEWRITYCILCHMSSFLKQILCWFEEKKLWECSSAPPYDKIK